MARQSAPYHFVPVDPGLAVHDRPVGHDAIRFDDQSWTGELNCELTALTPLLAANDQYKVADATEELRSKLHELVERRIRPNTIKDEKKFQRKAILEPMTLASNPGSEVPGAVVIAATQIKGMVRHSLAALLAAPMERVAERTFSFRPNIKLVSPKQRPRLSHHAGVVAEVGSNGDLTVWGLETNDLTYLRPDPKDDPTYNPRKPTPPDELASNALGARHGEASVREHVESARAATTASSVLESLKHLDVKGSILLPCRSGIDGEGILMEAFNRVTPDKKEHKRPYRWLLVPTGALTRRATTTIPAAIVGGWRETLEHLRDEEFGHLSRHPVVEKEDIEKAREAIDRLLREGFRPGDVIFYEKRDNRDVVTLGHHLRYRWRYRDSARWRTESDGQRVLREALAPTELERRVDSRGRPEGLTAARLLFGYVGSAGPQPDEKGLLTRGIGVAKHEDGTDRPTDFAQSMGRVRVNHAVERVEDREPADRFLAADRDFLVPLRPLGGPKPSAVEHYLRQDGETLNQRNDGGTMVTYGDAPDDVAGELNGRKFYLHNCRAKSDNTGSFESPGGRDLDADTLATDQSAVARYVSREGTKFRFTIRFASLRPWELGALLFVLAPRRADLDAIPRMFELVARAEREGLDLRSGDLDELAELLELPAVHRGALERYLARADNQWKDQPEGDPMLAHKIGHGRPLGLGSVAIAVDHIRRLNLGDDEIPTLDPADDDARDRLVARFAVHLASTLETRERRDEWLGRCLVPWLQVHRYIDRRPTRDNPLAYPRDAETGEIFDYHAGIRQDHAEGRKRDRASGARDPLGLKTLDELDR